jgi:hypothetical protein
MRMNRIASRAALGAAVLAIITFYALAAEKTAHKAAPQHGGSSAVLVPGADLKWSNDPDHPGVQVAPLQGDPGKGASHFFIKLPAGFAVPMHFHNADHWVAVVSGTLMLTPEGGMEKTLPAGSGFSFTGKKMHTTKCAEGTDCVLFVDARGKWDVIPADKK